MSEYENGTPASRSTVKRVEDKVDGLAGDLRSLNEALMGKPGFTVGVIAEQRGEIRELREQWIAFQGHFPETVNAAVDSALESRVVGRVRAWNGWIANVASAFIAGFLVAVAILVFHLGVQVAPK